MTAPSWRAWRLVWRRPKRQAGQMAMRGSRQADHYGSACRAVRSAPARVRVRVCPRVRVRLRACGCARLPARGGGGAGAGARVTVTGTTRKQFFAKFFYKIATQFIAALPTQPASSIMVP